MSSYVSYITVIMKKHLGRNNMRPQDNEPCVNCMHWNDETGCEMGRYDSASMVIFGHCGFCRPKEGVKTDKDNA